MHRVGGVFLCGERFPHKNNNSCVVLCLCELESLLDYCVAFIIVKAMETCSCIVSPLVGVYFLLGGAGS